MGSFERAGEVCPLIIIKMEINALLESFTKDIATGELIFDSFHIVTPSAWLECKGD